MDSGKGYFTDVPDEKSPYLEGAISESKNVPGIFYVGQILKINGSRFRLRKIKPREIILRVLPKNEN